MIRTEPIEGPPTTWRAILTYTPTRRPGRVKFTETIFVRFLETSRTVCERPSAPGRVKCHRIFDETLERDIIERRYALENRRGLNLDLAPDLGPNEFQDLGLHGFLHGRHLYLVRDIFISILAAFLFTTAAWRFALAALLFAATALLFAFATALAALKRSFGVDVRA